MRWMRFWNTSHHPTHDKSRAGKSVKPPHHSVCRWLRHVTYCPKCAFSFCHFGRRGLKFLLHFASYQMTYTGRQLIIRHIPISLIASQLLLSHFEAGSFKWLRPRVWLVVGRIDECSIRSYQLKWTRMRTPLAFHVKTFLLGKHPPRVYRPWPGAHTPSLSPF